MKDYLDSTKIVLSRLWFGSQGGLYRGSGHLIWEPETGVNLLANVTRTGAPPPAVQKIQSLSIRGWEDYASVYAKSPNVGHVLIPYAIDSDDLTLFFTDSVDVTVDRYVTLTRSKWNPSHDAWHGSAVYRVGHGVTLPHIVTVMSTLEDLKSEGLGREGIRLADDDISIVGRLENDEFLNVSWTLSNSKWTRSESWRLGEEIRWVLSFLLGKNVVLLQRSVWGQRTHYQEMRQRREVQSLREFLFVSQDPSLSARLFLPLVRFFLRGDAKEVNVAKHLIHQVATAARIGSQEASELLVATAYEAATRTLLNQPYSGHRDNWNIGKSHKYLRVKYWSQSQDWQDACMQLQSASKRLRERNAHPDWLTGAGGSYSQDSLTQSVDDIRFMCRFYGYMILGFAGIEILQPQFPPSVHNAPPLIEIRREIPKEAK